MYISKTVAANSCFKNLNPKHNESTEKLKYETGRFSRDAETKTCRETAPKQAGLAPAGLRQLSPFPQCRGIGVEPGWRAWLIAFGIRSWDGLRKAAHARGKGFVGAEPLEKLRVIL